MTVEFNLGFFAPDVELVLWITLAIFSLVLLIKPRLVTKKSVPRWVVIFFILIAFSYTFIGFNEFKGASFNNNTIELKYPFGIRKSIQFSEIAKINIEEIDPLLLGGSPHELKLTILTKDSRQYRSSSFGVNQLDNIMNTLKASPNYVCDNLTGEKISGFDKRKVIIWTSYFNVESCPV